MPDRFCGLIRDHGPHPWREWVRDWQISDLIRLRAGRRHCPGVVTATCGRNVTHPPHWCGEHYDEMCTGGGLAGVCAHGVQMLNECDECTTGS